MSAPNTRSESMLFSRLSTSNDADVLAFQTGRMSGKGRLEVFSGLHIRFPKGTHDPPAPSPAAKWTRTFPTSIPCSHSAVSCLNFST